MVCASCVHLVVNSPYFLMEMKPRVSVASIQLFHFKTFLPNLQSSIRIFTFRDQELGLRASDYKLPLSLSCGIYSWYQSISTRQNSVHNNSQAFMRQSPFAEEPYTRVSRSKQANVSRKAHSTNHSTRWVDNDLLQTSADWWKTIGMIHSHFWANGIVGSMARENT